MLTSLFWIILSIIIYTYFGYVLLLSILNLFVRHKNPLLPKEDELPEVSFIVAAYNEKDIIEKKVENSFQLNYPKNKIKYYWITDGSTDGSEQFLAGFKNIIVLHQSKRQGKMAAINRAMEVVSSPITVFSDANTILDSDSVLNLVVSLNDKNTGCVAGEKTILKEKKDNAAGAGEGLYWNYESLIKRLESNIDSTIGAAGELFAIKTDLFEAPDKDTVVDDLVISFNIAEKGYKVKYQSKAIACEEASISVAEEKKRKIRIAAGSFKVLFGSPQFLNIFRYRWLSFTYISHKVLRWLLVPWGIFLLLPINAFIYFQDPNNHLYQILLVLQLCFYFLVILGALLQKSRIRLKALFMPYYLVVMNFTIIQGFFRFLKGSQSAAWEKAKRK
jgi:cellulose synthase/poly-beta-1,6-N-acetylglucosamine synthase-like glycosyltransferase